MVEVTQKTISATEIKICLGVVVMAALALFE